jgi:thiosulfate sulfurtransferase
LIWYNYFMETFTRISASKAREIMSLSEVTLVDIRDANAFAQAHIDGAQNVNDENIKSFLEESDKEKPLVCYCYHGISSQRASEFFVSQGFKKVYSIDGGWEAWRSSNV